MNRRADLIAILIIFFVAISFCGRAVFSNRAMMPLDMLLLMYPWKAHTAELAPDFVMPQNPMLDPVQQYFPWRIFAVESVKSGIIPLWNPYSYCGQPFVANLQSAIFYPPNLIFLILPIGLAFTWSTVLHLFLAGLFMYLLLRHWQVHPIAGVFGAIAFMLNGYIVGWLEYPAFGQWVIVWLPAVLLCYDKAISQKSWLWTAICGVAISLLILGGQLQIAGYIILTFFLYAMWRIVGAQKAERISRGGQALAALLFGIALAAVQLLPTLELAPLSARTIKTLADAKLTAFPLTHFILYFMPGFFGNPSSIQYPYWFGLVSKLPTNFFETGCYVGIPTLLLAWLNLRVWRKPLVGFLLTLTVLSVLLAIGSPVYSLLYHIGPGMKQLLGLARVLCITAFALAGLAAFGLNRLLEKERLAMKWWEIPSFVGVTLVTLAATWAIYSPVLLANVPLLDNFGRDFVRLFGLLIVSCIAVWLLSRQHKATKQDVQVMPVWKSAVAGFVVLLLVVDLFSFGMHFNPATDTKLAFFPTRATDLLKQHESHNRIVSYLPATGTPQAPLQWMLPNTPLAYGLRDIHGYDSLTPGRLVQVMGFTDWGKQGSWPEPGSPLIDMLGIEHAATIDRIDAPGWDLLEAAEMNVYEKRNPMPRAFAVYGAIRMPEAQALQTVRTGAFLPQQEVVLIGEAEITRNGLPAHGVEFLADGVNSVRLQADMRADGYVVLSDTAYPGWQAYLDGKRTYWEPANYTFRAIATPRGRHTIEWRYEPATFRIGLYISLAAWAFLCGVIAQHLFGRYGRGSTASI